MKVASKSSDGVKTRLRLTSSSTREVRTSAAAGVLMAPGRRSSSSAAGNHNQAPPSRFGLHGGQQQTPQPDSELPLAAAPARSSQLPQTAIVLP